MEWLVVKDSLSDSLANLIPLVSSLFAAQYTTFNFTFRSKAHVACLYWVPFPHNWHPSPYLRARGRNESSALTMFFYRAS